jgi:hypothetical protein
MVEDRLTVGQDIAPHEGEILTSEVAFDHLDRIDDDDGEVIEVELRAVIGAPNWSARVLWLRTGAGAAPRMLGGLPPRHGRRGSPHGWRATFRSWCADTGVAREVAESALGTASI